MEFRPRKMSEVDVSAITINFGFGMCACIKLMCDAFLNLLKSGMHVDTNNG